MRSFNAVLSARFAPDSLTWGRLVAGAKRGKRGTAAASAALVTASLATGILFVAAPGAQADPLPVAERTSSMVTADALPTVQIDGVAWSQAIAGNTVYVGGSFNNARPAGAAANTNQTARTNLLSYTLSTGVLNTSFNPAPNQQVRAVSVSPDGTKLFIGGDFTTVGGVTHNRIAEFNASTGALISAFTANLDGGVRALYATNDTVYAAGVFSMANQTPRARVAAFSAANGTLLPWNPSADAVVTALTMTPDKSRIVLGGSFQNLGSTPTYGLGAVDPINGTPMSWAATAQIQDAGANAGITALTSDNTAVYGTGYVFGAGGNLEGGFSTDSSGNINWIEDCHGDTYGVYAGTGAVYTISHSHYCNNVGAFPQTDPWTFHHSLAWTTQATGTLLHDQTGGAYHDWGGSPSPTQYNWYPDFTTGSVTGQNQAAWAVTGNGSYVIEGGEFPTVNGTAQQGLVRFAIPSISGHKQGAMVTGSKFVPTIVSLTPGTARIAFQANWDRDDEVLTYKVVRNSNTAAPVYTTTVTSQFFNRPNLGFTDTGLVAGTTYKYRLYVTDPDGNQVAGDTVSYTEPATNPQSQYAKDVVADGATDYWRLSESSGSTAYDYASFNDLTLGSTVTHGATGAITGDADTADNFDGSTTGLAATNNAIPGPNTFTEEAWFKTTSTSGGKILGFGNANTGTSSSYDRHIYMDGSGHLYFGVYNGNTTTISTPNALNDGQYHYVVASLSSAGMSLYVDGKFVGNNSNTVAQAYNGYWRVGGDSSWSGANFFTGTIDDVAIYPTVLTTAQIRQHYIDSGRTFAGITAPADSYGKTIYNDSPNLYYRMDETSGTTATDVSGNGNDGTYNGGQTLGTSSPVSGGTGTAVTFNGSNGTLASNTQVQAPAIYSEEIWFNTTTNQGGKLIGFGNTQSGNSSNYDRHIYMENSGQLTFGTYTGQLNTATTTASYNDGKWHHMVATQAGDGMKLYVDGVLAATNPQTQAQGYSGYWRIGGDSDWGGNSPYFAGTLDEAAVYPYELTPTQITNHYQASPAATQPNKAPIATIAETSSNLTVNVDGTGSTDPDGTIASYAWDFGDGSTATTSTATHTYAAAGNYTITLVVTDNQGATSTATQAVSVSGADPCAGRAVHDQDAGCGRHQQFHVGEVRGPAARQGQPREGGLNRAGQDDRLQQRLGVRRGQGVRHVRLPT